MQKLFAKIFNFIFWIISGIRKRLIKENSARKYSNRILKKYLNFLGGDIINVSGWEDADKCGEFYRNYYGSVSSYTISNIEGENGMPKKPDPKNFWIYLDLEKQLTQALESKFDIVFCHTVLEHIFHLQLAIENLVKLTKDVIVLVVPFSQEVHFTSSYGDYFRLTPLYLKRFFEDLGFSVLLCDANEQPFNTIYIVFFVSRFPEKHPEFNETNKHFNINVVPSRFGKYKLHVKSKE